MWRRQIARKLLSGLLAFLMVYTVAAEGAAPVYADDPQTAEETVQLQQTEEQKDADTPVEKAQVQDTSTGEPETQDDAVDLAGEPETQDDTADPAGEPETQDDTADLAGEPEEQDDTADPAGEPEEQDDAVDSAGQEVVKDDDEKAAAPIRRTPVNDLTNGFYVYFAVPSSWSSYSYDHVAFTGQKGGSGSGANLWSLHTMTDTGRTYNGMKVYSVALTEVANDTSSDVPWGGLNSLYFQGRSGDSVKVQVQTFRRTWNSTSVFANKLYANGSWLSDFDYDAIHKNYGGKIMAFENDSGATISGIQAIFYERDDAGTLQQVSTVTVGDVQNQMYLTFKIPTDSCSYVRFVDGDGNVLGDSYSYFYGDDGFGGTETGTKRFAYDASSAYAYQYSGSADSSAWGTANSRYTVYFVIPNSWSSVNYNRVVLNAKKGQYDNVWTAKDMTDTHRTHDGKKVYAVELTGTYDQSGTEIPWHGVHSLQFQAYSGSTWRTQVKVYDKNWTEDTVFANKMYYNGVWMDLELDPAHQDLCGKTMTFQNLSGADLSGVRAIFYEKDDDGGLQQVDAVTVGDVEQDIYVTFHIPDDPCSYVRFEDGDGNLLGDAHSYFYGDDGLGGDETDTEQFQFDADSKYGYRYYGSADNSDWGTTSYTCTVYFALPVDWTADHIRFTGRRGSTGTGLNSWIDRNMTDTGRTYQKRKVYAIELTSTYNNSDSSVDMPWDGLYTMHFNISSSENGQDICSIDHVWTEASVFRNKMYYRDGNTWEWIDFDPDLYDIVHADYCGKSMAFENLSGGDLASVQAIFYEPDDTGTLQTVATVPVGDVADGDFASFRIPDDPCSYVRFVDGNGNTLGDDLSYFYGDDGKDTVTADEKFTFDENAVYAYRYRGSGAGSDWGMTSGSAVYFDATLSSLPVFTEDVKNNQFLGVTGYEWNPWYYSIPNSKEGDGNVYFCAKVKEGDDYRYVCGAMEPVAGKENIYVAQVPVCEAIQFSSFLMKPDDWEVFPPTAPQFGKFTDWETVPDDLTEPCFYADSGDDSIYENKYRSGYWDEMGQLRDAEKAKGTDVVNIHSGDFVYNSEVFYVNSTFYDYYTDYELNGFNKDNFHDRQTYTGVPKFHSYRNWAPFRHFDQALSDAYQNAGAGIALYTGHFQPSIFGWSNQYWKLQEVLELYGYDGNENGFFSTNNSSVDASGHTEETYGSAIYRSAAQGLVNSQLSGGSLMTADGKMMLPYFSEGFLRGNNSKNTVLGEVYHNVQFPFTEKDLYDNGVSYWVFDSSETTLAMRRDPSYGYFLYDDGELKGWAKNVNSTGTNSGSSVNEADRDKLETTYGFYPFNEDSVPNNGATYNFGFGAKLELTFRLTEDGTVLDRDGNKVPIEFSFSGDDDVWVFVDGKLALDMGGAHKRVEGNLNFQTMEATVSLVKSSEGSDYTNLNEVDGPSGMPRRKAPGQIANGAVSAFTINGEKTDEHTLTVFYMERGMWESDMKMSFNFPDENQLNVSKTVDTASVNDLFLDLFADTDFTFTIRNLATHFGQQSVAATQAGFGGDQASICDYGSAESGSLMAAEGAAYTSSRGTARDGSVNADGAFVIGDGETVTFANQFRRGSYIALEEALEEQKQNLYTVMWTVSEPDEGGTPAAVTSFGTGDSVANGNRSDLKNQTGAAVDDGRIEQIVPGRGSTGSNRYQSGGAGYHPENTFVFRSYREPDGTGTMTRLDVAFTNQVNTGSLTVRKNRAYADDELDGDYSFVVAFDNVGGIGLESSTIYTDPFTLKVGEQHTIDGIPVGTEYTVYELKDADGDWALNSVTVDGADVSVTETTVNGSDAYAAGGTIPNEDGAETVCTFVNTMDSVVTVTATKVWDDEENSDKLRSDVTLTLQSTVDGENYTDVETATIAADAEGDALTVAWENLPVRVNGENVTYRVTEAAMDGYQTTITSENQDGVIAFTVTNYHSVTPPKPDEPTKPEKPDEPTNPTEPETPDDSGSGKHYTRSHKRSGKNTPKTGDDSNLMLWTVLGLTAAAACGGTLVLGRKKNRYTGRRQR